MRGTFLYADEDGHGGWRPPPLRRDGDWRSRPIRRRLATAPSRGAAAGRHRLGGRGMGNWGSRRPPPSQRQVHRLWNNGVFVDDVVNQSTMVHWKVEAIPVPLRPVPQDLPRPTPVSTPFPLDPSTPRIQSWAEQGS